MSGAAIVWFRDDLRVADHPALLAAVEHGGPVLPVVVLDEVSPEVRPLGGAAKWWLHHSLAALRAELADRGAELVLRRGAADAVLADLAAETRATAVFWNRRYSAAREVDARLKRRLADTDVEAHSFTANLLAEPWTVTADDEPFQVFTPFWHALQQRPVRNPLPAPDRIPGVGGIPSDRLEEWGLLPTRPDWAGGLRDTWVPGEAAAQRALETFAEDGLAEYHLRDHPAVGGSRLSPRLRFGELSPVQVWHRMHGDLTPPARRNVDAFLRELGWREFNWHTLFAFPELATRNVDPRFDAFPWSWDEGPDVAAWRRGRTGIPLVDAGMRELRATGWLPNRVRMVVASFLVKNLLRHWRIGETWFWDTLVDADEANNSASWQWVAGSGLDPAPYFRVFNPELQREKFDPDGGYVRRWVDPAERLKPIVDLAASRRAAIAAFESIRSGGDRRAP